LVHYLKGEALEKVPVWCMVSMPLDEVERRARLWAQVIGGMATVVKGETMLGGGSLPGSTLPTRLVSIEGKGTKKAANLAQLLSQKLRQYDPPVIGRINGNVLFLDPRSVLPEEDGIVLKTLKDVALSLK
jgi:L-seryl-tRNA(Ser) seleniumtransferase